jgi:DNA-directed RNA polymerase subunit beta'
MALELFKPFVMRRLVELGKVENIKGAKRAIERSAPASEPAFVAGKI